MKRPHLRSDSAVPFLRTRREFLRSTLLGAAAASSVPAFVHGTFRAMNAAAQDAAVQTPSGRDASILVILQLAGGNDGLNTVAPFADDAYHRARPQLALGKGSLLPIGDGVCLHGALPFLRESFERGELAIVQGVGYPNPNRSHFRSTEIWQTATDAEGVSKTGWLGRYFDHACAGAEPDPLVGIGIAGQQPQAFAAARNPGISLSSPERYRWFQSDDPEGMAVEFFRELNQPEDAAEDQFAGASAGANVEEVNGGKGAGKPGGSALDFLERTALDAQLSSDRIRALAAKHRSRASYPGTRLANSLSLVARMIAGGLPTRVYYVSHGGFDTHRDQARTHQRLLGELDAALRAFHSDVKEQGNEGRVTLMTFSEFGRRVAENASKGTDHGAAAPLFVLGAGVRGGLHGAAPSLEDLDRGDLKFTTDFRSVYATVLDKCLGTPVAPVLGRDFARLGFLG